MPSLEHRYCVKH